MDRKLEQLLTPKASMSPVLLHLTPAVCLTDDQLLELSSINECLNFELTSEGDLIIMPPTGGETSRGNAYLTRSVGNWTEVDGTGVDFDSSSGFRLANNALRSPDAAWIRRERWEAIPIEQRRSVPHICPDFVIELRSSSDRLRVLQAKVQEYLDNGLQLGWLIDSRERKAHIYRPGAPPEVLDNPEAVSGGPILPAFTLDLTRFWPD